MQSNTLKILAGQSVSMPCSGNGFWFESGTSTTADTYIIVKPDTGAEFRVKPGQSVKDPGNMVSVWTIRADDPAAVITGNVIIGNGDFADSNTNSTTTLTNSTIGVNNTTANRVPVSADITQTIPVNIIGGSAQNIVYTSSHTSNSALVANTAVQVVAPAANVNGVVINRSLVVGNSSGDVAILAKATAPTSVADGDLLAYASATSAGFNTATEDSQIKVPAGRGIWVISGFASSPMRSLLYTVL